MNGQPKKDCCNGCQNGQPGGNASCQAKLMVEAIHKAKEGQVLDTKNKVV